jgi:hypothetical protein
LFLNKLEKAVSFYVEKNYGGFLEVVGLDGFPLKKHEDKKKLEKLMMDLIELRKTSTVKIILDYIFNNNLISKSDKIEKFEQKLLSPDPDDKKYKDFYNSLCLLNYNEFILINEFIDGFTPQIK